MIKLNIDLKQNSYPVYIGDGLISRMNESCEVLRGLCPGKRAAVVTDENVWTLHGGTLRGFLGGAGIECNPLIVITPGETGKSFANLERLCGEFNSAGLLRNDPVIAFGGGVTGDLAGFAAAVYMRGVPFVQIPTTLLAQVDSSVGGKVAVNLGEGKNLAGAFHQPRLVIADTSLLATLPAREFSAGMAEVIKYAAIKSAELPVILENGGKIDYLGTRGRIGEIVAICCRCKSGYVERDEFDTGERMMLNFGHTFAHAIEKLYNYEKYNHGEAVAAGMIMAARTGERLGVTAHGTVKRIMRLTAAAGLPVDAGGLDSAGIAAAMVNDKKNDSPNITLVLLREFTQPFVYRIDRNKLAELL